jgi:uncharacterized membrane protein YfcA
MTPAVLAVCGISVLATSFLSGIVGMAGGMILMGILLAVLDVGPAMVLHGTTQMASNGWRGLLWRNYVDWRIVGGYLLGALAAFGLMRLVAFVPDKATVFIALGAMPFLADLMPAALKPDITRRLAAPICGAVVMAVQILAGVAGSILDVFFQKSVLDRKTVVATKAVTQTIGHALRIAYFGAVAQAFSAGVEAWVYLAAMALAITGTSLAAFVLHRMSDEGFRRWSRRIINAVSLVFLARGLWLLGVG